MAPPKTRWLLSILVISVSAAAPGPPAPPLNVKCFRPCDEIRCHVDIQCTWDSESDPKIPTNYTLHWEPSNSQYGISLNSQIPREGFSGEGELRVWVEASNQHGSAKSQKITFNVEDIIKPPPPVNITNDEEPLEILWSTSCTELESSGSCDIRYRAEEDKDWSQQENGVHGSYTVLYPKPFTVYEFQVRCTCGKGLVSDWSSYTIRSAESNPVGKVDVWRDCGISPTSSDCALTWKNLSISQARGLILGYELTVSYSNGSALLINVSTAEPSSQYVHNEMKWYLTSPLKDVSSVSISAYNALNATEPSFLVIPLAGKEENTQKLDLTMNEENLTVSWEPPSQVSDDLREYVVQYKQAGSPPGLGFDWIRVNKSQKTAFFQGQFQKYKAYQVSVFTVSNRNEVCRLSSAIGYSLQKAPSTVHLFKVAAIADTSVTLSWEPGPLPEQTARILYYQLVLDTQKVYNASFPPHHQNITFTLPDLSPSRDYEVWISAITEAGPGKNVSRTFTTKHQQNFGFLISAVFSIVPVIICACIAYTLLSVCRGPNKACPLMPSCVYEKVPDPRNSHIFKQKKHQFNEPLGWICIPVCEPQPKISLLEVVKIKSQDLNPEPVIGDKCSKMDSQDDQRKDAVAEESERIDRRYGREAYSKMVDSDMETGDDYNSEEEQFTSGYEKHFMPSPLEVL